MDGLLCQLQRPMSARFAVYCNVLSLREPSLVVGTSCAIDIYDLSPDGLQLVHSIPVYTNLMSLVSFRPFQNRKAGGLSRTCDWLLFSTADGRCHSIHYNGQRFERSQCIEPAATVHRTRQNDAHHLIVNPTGQYMLLHAYEGFFTLFKVDLKAPAGGQQPTSLVFTSISSYPLDFINVLSIVFLDRARQNHHNASPRVAILYKDYQGDCVVSVFSTRAESINVPAGVAVTAAAGLVAAGHDHTDGAMDDLFESRATDAMFKKLSKHATFHGIGPSAQFLMSTLQGHAIVVRENDSLMLCDMGQVFENKKSSPRRSRGPHDYNARPLHLPPGFRDKLCTYVRIDASRYILAATSGALYLLLLQYMPETETLLDPKLIRLGVTSPAAKIIHISAAYFFVASHYSHSTLIRINMDDSDKDDLIEPVDRIDNLGPTVDFFVDSKNSTIKTVAPVVVSASGSLPNGTIRRMKWGRSKTVLAEIMDIEARYIWAGPNGVLVVSTARQTLKLHINRLSGHISHLNDRDLVTETPTLYISEVGGELLQVTARGVFQAAKPVWRCESEDIIFAASHEGLILCVHGTALVGISSTDWLPEFELSFDHEICAFALNDSIVALAFWGYNSVRFARFSKRGRHSLGKFFTVGLPDSSVCRSLQIKGMELLVGLATGDLLVYPLKDSNCGDLPPEQLVMGLRPITLFPSSQNILLASENLIIGTEWTARFSLVDVPSPIWVTEFDNEYYGSGILAIATGQSLQFIKLGDSTAMSLQETSFVDYSIQKVAPAYASNTIVALMMSEAAQLDTEYVLNGEHKSLLSLLDFDSFRTLDSMTFKVGELLCSIAHIVSPELGFDGFAVGTTISVDGPTADSEATVGRIHLISVSEDRKLKVNCSLSAPGGVYSMAFGGHTDPFTRFHVTVGNQLRTVCIDESSEGQYSLRFLEDNSSPLFESHSLAVALASRGNQLAVGDLMRGVSKITLDQDLHKLAVKRQVLPYGAFWTATTELLSSTFLVSASAYGDVVFSELVDGSYYHTTIKLDTMVNRIVVLGYEEWITIPFFSRKLWDHDVQPLCLLSTVSGGMYALCRLDSDLYKILSDVSSWTEGAVTNAQFEIARTTETQTIFDGVILDWQAIKRSPAPEVVQAREVLKFVEF